MHFKKIATRMLTFILPVITIAMLVMTGISASFSEQSINTQIAENMKSELKAQNKAIEQQLQEIMIRAESTAYAVSVGYKTTDISTYEKILAQSIGSNDKILGSGIWFEPYVYDAKEEYVGPYIYKANGRITTTYEYSNADYDYFSQEYYTRVKETGEGIITDPYYDATSGIIMSTCSVPMYCENQFIGCITVDMSLNDIQNLVDSIKVGVQGKGMMFTNRGVYLGGVEKEKVENEKNILEDENVSLVEAGKIILGQNEGDTSYTVNGALYHLYYITLKGVNWKLMISMPDAELNQPVRKLIVYLSIIFAIAVILSITVIVYQVSNIAKGIKGVKEFLKQLAIGNFKIETIKVKTRDEIGDMGKSLNEMYVNNKEVISSISKHAIEIDHSSDALRNASDKLLNEFDHIKTYISQVNAEMMSTSAATEEINASTEEVNSNINILANETIKSMDMAKGIRSRAKEVGQASQSAYDKANELTMQFEMRLQDSIENAKVVENIGSLAKTISAIAEEINLLSLNASIEAARAGEQGRGFAVVASEIGKLANDTSKAVVHIQDTISEVYSAFNGLTGEANEILGFIKHTVTPDYNRFVGVALQYGKDAESIEQTSSMISDMSNSIKDIMHEMTGAMEEIAEAAQQTADLSGKIMKVVGEVSNEVESVANMSIDQESIAKELNEVVGRFELE